MFRRRDALVALRVYKVHSTEKRRGRRFYDDSPETEQEPIISRREAETEELLHPVSALRFLRLREVQSPQRLIGINLETGMSYGSTLNSVQVEGIATEEK